MPDSMHLIDAGLPRWNGEESSEEKLDRIQNYLFMLLEELRYLLRHLSGENFSESGAREVVVRAFGDSDGGTGNTIVNLLRQSETFETLIAGTMLTGSLVANELYANYGDIADLTVWRLRTDFLRAYNYLHGDRRDVNFIRIQEEQIDFVTASVSEGTEQLSRDGALYYWTDESRSRMTCRKTTPWPVTVYRYDEAVKMTIRFQSYVTTQGESTYAPVITLGAGDEQGNSKGFIFKEQNDLIIRYLTSDGENTDVCLSDYVDARHRRLASCVIDTNLGTVRYTVEGDENEYTLTFSENGDTVTYTWPDGHSCEVSVL